MWGLQFYDYLRVLTAIFACVAAYRLTHHVKDHYKAYTNRMGEWVWIMLAVLFTQFTGAIENIIKGTDFRYGSLLSLLIAAAAVRATRAGGPFDFSK